LLSLVAGAYIALKKKNRAPIRRVCGMRFRLETAAAKQHC